MARCDTCGNDYDKAFTVTQGDRSGTFDSFECAIHAMAPRCAHCGCTITRARSIAAPTARGMPACRASTTAHEAVQCEARSRCQPRWRMSRYRLYTAVKAGNRFCTTPTASCLREKRK